MDKITFANIEKMLIDKRIPVGAMHCVAWQWLILPQRIVSAEVLDQIDLPFKGEQRIFLLTSDGTEITELHEGDGTVEERIRALPWQERRDVKHVLVHRTTIWLDGIGPDISYASDIYTIPPSVKTQFLADQ